MRRDVNVADALKVEELRAGFLVYTRQAYALVPPLVRPRILDIGCGAGLPTIELARLGGGEVTGIDTDASALVKLRRKIDEVGVGDRVKALNASLFDTGLAEESFDILWEEGVLHLLDPTSSFSACRRLLKQNRFLVMHETVTWFDGIRSRIAAVGFEVIDRLLLPTRTWWTDYYAPLEARIQAFRREHGEGTATSELAQYEREINMVKANPERFDCGFFVLQKGRPDPAE